MTDAHVLTDDAGSVTVTPAAVSQIVVAAAEAAAGARVRRPRRALEVSVAEGRARVELELSTSFGVVLPDLARDVQARVARALEEMCGLEVEAVDIAIEELEE